MKAAEHYSTPNASRVKMQKSLVLWRQILRKNFTDWEKLADFLELSNEQRQKILDKKQFGLNLPWRLAQTIAKSTLDDPILKQFLPTAEEAVIASGFQIDPVHDQEYRKEAKFLQKYPGRALLICTSACAMHCRYCFRQNFDYERERGFSKEIELIRQDSTLREIILSGGDPLSLDDAVLNELLDSIEKIPHVRRIRFHTRFPIGIPERIDEGFLALLKNRRIQLWFVVHVNHPRELDEEVLARLKNVQRLGIPVLNQSVLLKGINDDIATHKQLCEILVDNGILPYYLHQLDRVQGTAHFEVDQNDGLQLVKELSASLSGYAVPKYVSEIPGRSSKTPL